MTVMPPSIHPETGRPYEFVGTALPGADFADLPELDQGKVNLIKIVVASEETQSLISGGGTHDAGLKMVAKLVQAGASDQVIEGIIASLLPDSYSGNSLEELPEWIASARRKGFDEAPARKTRQKRRAQSDELIELFQKTGAQLFHDEGRRAYMTIQTLGGGYRHIPLRSNE